jgi:hypothetical protein
MARTPQIIPAFRSEEIPGIPESVTAMTKGDAATPPPPRRRGSLEGTRRVMKTTLSM